MRVMMHSLEQRTLFSAGLSAQYFDNSNLTTSKLTRTDAQINFDWSAGSPSPSIGADTFSARWTGYVQPQYSQKYTFTATVDDGVRVWVDNKLVIDHWKAPDGTYTGTVDLTAGSYVPIKVEYYENLGKAKMQLKWSSASQAQQIVPSSRLFTSVPSSGGSSGSTGGSGDGSGSTSSPSEIIYSGPIKITRGGTYSGNWQSNDPNTPAVIVATTEPVTITNSNIRSRGDLIHSWVDHTNITISGVTGTALNPNVAGQSPGRFLDDEHFNNIVVQSCTLNGTSGILLDTYAGNYSSSNTIKILSNNALNIDGRHSNGAGGFVTYDARRRKSDGKYEEGYDIVQFVQVAKAKGLAGIEIAGNRVINQPGLSRVEDNISIYASSGTSSSPIKIHDNYIKGAYNVAPWQTDYSDSAYNYSFDFAGGGIMLGDSDGSSSNVPAYVNAYNNTIIDTTNYGLAITSGHNLQIYNNKVSSSGKLPDGRTVVNQNVGIGIWNANGESSSMFYSNGGHDNEIYWFDHGVRNDWWTPNASNWDNNVHSSTAFA